MPQERKPDYDSSDKVDLNESKKIMNILNTDNWEDENIDEKEEEIEPWENKNNPPWKNFLLFFADILLNAAIIITIVFTIRHFLVTPFQVSGESMLDTLHDKEYIIVNKLDYRFNEPERGDPIVFVPPTHSDQYYVKRIIGIPGDTIIIENGKVKIQNAEDPAGHYLDEPYLNKNNQGNTFLPNSSMNETFQVPEGYYFVLGDNRENSTDSRRWRDPYTNEPIPYISKEKISGKVWVVLWPLNEIRRIAPFF